MGGGTSMPTATRPPSREEAVHTLKKANTEARKLQLLLSSIGKTHFHEKVLACVKVEFLSHERAQKTASDDYVLGSDDCMQIVNEAFTECFVPPEFHDPVKRRLLQRIPLTVKEVYADDLMHVLGQAMCQYNSYLKAKTKFAELDTDNSGYLDGPELNKVVDWMLRSIVESGVELNADEEEMRKLMLDRIDADGDHRLSLDEFVVLFEEEQRKAIVMRYARQKFAEFDVDGSGELSEEELEKVVDWLLDITGEDLERADKDLVKRQLMTNRARPNKDGVMTIALDTFLELCESEIERVELKRRARDKFMELDTKRVGYLENDDLEKVINFMYHSLGAKDSGNKKEGTKRDLLGRLRMAKVDANGDGKLDVDEFIALFENLYLEANQPLERLSSVKVNDDVSLEELVTATQQQKAQSQ